MPTLGELQRLAKLATRSYSLHPTIVSSSPGAQHRRLVKRLPEETILEIVRRYEEGEHTPHLCKEYGISKTAILRLLRANGVQLRRQPLEPEKVAEAVRLYESGLAIAPIAKRLGTTLNNVRLNLLREGVELRSRGGNYRRS